VLRQQQHRGRRAKQRTADACGGGRGRTGDRRVGRHRLGQFVSLGLVDAAILLWPRLRNHLHLLERPAAEPTERLPSMPVDDQHGATLTRRDPVRYCHGVTGASQRCRVPRTGATEKPRAPSGGDSRRHAIMWWGIVPIGPKILGLTGRYEGCKYIGVLTDT